MYENDLFTKTNAPVLHRIKVIIVNNQVGENHLIDLGVISQMINFA